MMHRGYEIREAEYHPVPHLRARSMAIIAGGRVLEYVEDAPLAARVIDEKIRAGRWPDREQEANHATN